VDALPKALSARCADSAPSRYKTLKRGTIFLQREGKRGEKTCSVFSKVRFLVKKAITFMLAATRCQLLSFNSTLNFPALGLQADPRLPLTRRVAAGCRAARGAYWADSGLRARNPTADHQYEHPELDGNRARFVVV
jgi:hypothetical protein